jgi:hypothetical protein
MGIPIFASLPGTTFTMTAPTPPPPPTLASVSAAYTTAWLQGQTPATRAVFAMQEFANENAVDYLARVGAAGKALSAPVNGPVTVGHMTPLFAFQEMGDELGLSEIGDEFNRPGSSPVPKVHVLADGTVDLSPAGVAATLAALAAAYPVQADFLPTARPFGVWNAKAGSDLSEDGLGSWWAPLPGPGSPVGATWTDPSDSHVYTLTALYGSAGANGVAVLMWVRTA